MHTLCRSSFVVAVVVSIALATAPLAAVQAPPLRDKLDLYGSHDARVDLQRAARAAASPAQRAAIDALATKVVEAAVDVDPATGATRTLMNRGGFLTAPDRSAAADVVARRWVEDNATLLGLTAADLAEAETSDHVWHDLSGTTNLYLRQRIGGLPVYNGLLSVNLDRDNRIVGVNNLFLPKLASALNASSPALSAEAAIDAAAAHLGLATGELALVSVEDGAQRGQRFAAPALSQEAIDARLMVLPIRAGEARLVWNFQIWTLDSLHAWDFTIDAIDGRVWTRFDWVANEQYKAYGIPVEAPSFSTTPPITDGRTIETNPFLDLSGGTFFPFGWHDTNNLAGAESTLTIGNAVSAYTDTDSNNTPDAGSQPDGTATLNFTTSPTFDVDLSTQAPSAYRPAAVANLFYMNSIMHDVTYPYGFNEVGGNFQAFNFGRGGAQNDAVNGEAQDGSGTNNANFATPADGSKPRMQMYIWTAPTPDRDGDFDNGIIAHEYGHGISNRLVGGPSNVSCLGNTQQPGEGLSDWWSLWVTHPNTTSAASRLRGIGTYALNQPTTGPGIRTDYYDGDPATNPEPQENLWTYSTIGSMAVPHGVGSVWAQIYWEVTWKLIDLHGYDANLYNYTGTAADAGNIRAMYYIIQGLKNTVCSPRFIDVRDGIIQAATASYGGADVCPIWQAFAAVGLGTDAVSASGGSNTVTNGVAIPTSCSFVGTVDASETICAGSNATFTVGVGTAFTPPVTLALTGNPSPSTASFSPNPVVALPANSVLTIANTASVPAGSYAMTVSGNGDTTPGHTLALQLEVASGPSAAPALNTPADGATGVSTAATFTWVAVAGATGYVLEVDDDPAFGSIDYSANPTGTTHTVATPLAPNTVYYWRMRTVNPCTTGGNSAARSFRTANQICILPALAIPDNVPAGVNSDMVVGATGTIYDLNLKLRVTHTFVGDLKFSLTKVGGPTTVVAFDRPGSPATTNGCASDNIDTVLDDEAASPVETQCSGTPPAINGTFSPNNPLGAFDGQSLTGTWRLNASDNAGVDLGTVLEWCIVVNTDAALFSDGFESGGMAGTWSAMHQ